MIKNNCSLCGSKFAVAKAVFASKSIPLICPNCGSTQYRRHHFSNALAVFGFSIGLFISIYLYMAYGFRIVFISFVVYMLVLSAAYFSELLVCNLSEFGKAEQNIKKRQSTKNVCIFVSVLIVGAVLHFLEI